MRILFILLTLGTFLHSMDKSDLDSPVIGKLPRVYSQEEVLDQIYGKIDFTGQENEIIEYNEEIDEEDNIEDNDCDESQTADLTEVKEPEFIVETIFSELPKEGLVNNKKGLRTVCKLCLRTPKDFLKHLSRVHFICSCDKKYECYGMVFRCKKTHKRFVKNPDLLKYALGIKEVPEKVRKKICKSH